MQDVLFKDYKNPHNPLIESIVKKDKSEIITNSWNKVLQIKPEFLKRPWYFLACAKLGSSLYSYANWMLYP